MEAYMGGCQNYSPFLSTLNITWRIIIGIQKGTIILATTHRISNLVQTMENQMGKRMELWPYYPGFTGIIPNLMIGLWVEGNSLQ